MSKSLTNDQKAVLAPQIEEYINSLSNKTDSEKRMLQGMIPEYLKSHLIQNYLKKIYPERMLIRGIVKFANRVPLDTNTKELLYEHLEENRWIEEDAEFSGSMSLRELLNHFWNRIKHNKFLYLSDRAKLQNPFGVFELTYQMERNSYLSVDVSEDFLDTAKIDFI